MKIWITRKSASEIQYGGLERLQVWFQEPMFYYRKYKPYGDSAFSCLDEKGMQVYGIKDDGWDVLSGCFQNYVPFTKIFGFGDSEFPKQNEFVMWVWDQVIKHFDDKPFDDWDKMEHENPMKYHKKYFLLYASFDFNTDLRRAYDLSELHEKNVTNHPQKKKVNEKAKI